jgi:cytoskeletal protein RodZ
MFNIGSSLQDARTRQDLGFEEMEQRTKVRAKYLRLLEDERFDQLPGHAYTKGFLQVYADALGLDGRLYVEEYNSRYVAGEDDASPRLPRGPARAPRNRRERRETRTVGIALAAIMIVTALVIAAWRFGGHDTPRVDGVPPAARVAASTRSAQQRSAQQRVTLTVRAVRGPSFMEVRTHSESGAPLYTGTLDKGQVQRFTQKALFLSVARPRNVVVKVDGQRIALSPSGRLTVSGATTVTG